MGPGGVLTKRGRVCPRASGGLLLCDCVRACPLGPHGVGLGRLIPGTRSALGLVCAGGRGEGWGEACPSAALRTDVTSSGCHCPQALPVVSHPAPHPPPSSLVSGQHTTGLENWPGGCTHTDTHSQAHFWLPRLPPGLTLRPLAPSQPPEPGLHPGLRLLLPCRARSLSPALLCQVLPQN